MKSSVRNVTRRSKPGTVTWLSASASAVVGWTVAIVELLGAVGAVGAGTEDPTVGVVLAIDTDADAAAGVSADADAGASADAAVAVVAADVVVAVVAAVTAGLTEGSAAVGAGRQAGAPIVRRSDSGRYMIPMLSRLVIGTAGVGG